MTHSERYVTLQRGRVFFSLVLVIFALATIQPIMGISTQATPSLPWLHVQGNRIVDENGATVILRGVNIEEQYDMRYLGFHSFDETDMIELAQNWHINIIRVPIIPELWQYYPSYLNDILDPIVSLGNKYGIYIMLDWHAAGNSVTGQSIRPSWSNSPPFHGDPFNVSVALATSFWNSVAERYKNDPHVVYDIFNEPAQITWADWRPVAEQLVDVVRSHNPKALILVPGVSWAYDLRLAGQNPIRRENIVYGTHPYPGGSTYHGPWDQYFGYLTDSYPVLAGEWGFQPGDSDFNLDGTTETYGKPLLAYMTQKGMSWTAFVWSSVWDPPMLQSRYVATQFGQLVKDTLIASGTTNSSATTVTQSSTSQVINSTTTSTSTSSSIPTTNQTSTTITTSSSSSTNSSTSQSTTSSSTVTPTINQTSTSSSTTTNQSTSSSSAPTLTNSTTTSSTTMTTSTTTSSSSTNQVTTSTISVETGGVATIIVTSSSNSTVTAVSTGGSTSGILGKYTGPTMTYTSSTSTTSQSSQSTASSIPTSSSGESVATSSTYNSTIGHGLSFIGTPEGMSYSWFCLFLLSIGGFLLKPILPSTSIRSRLRQLTC